MASRQLRTTESAHAARTEDTRRAEELTEQFTGWKAFSSRDGRTRVATRTTALDPPDADDPVWAATLLADSWTDLELQLKEQAQADALRTYA